MRRFIAAFSLALFLSVSPSWAGQTLIFVPPSASVPTVTPTTWNPADKGSNITLSDGDLKATLTATSWHGVRSVAGVTTGKYYWEVGYSYTTNGIVGVATATKSLTTGAGVGAWVLALANTIGCNAGLGGSCTGSFLATGTVGIALNMTTGKIWFRDEHGAWCGGGDPVAGTGESCSGLSGTLYAYCAGYTNTKWWFANFGASAFTFAVPAGYSSGFGN